MYIDKSNGIKLHEKGDDQIIIIIVVFVTDTFFPLGHSTSIVDFSNQKIYAV